MEPVIQKFRTALGGFSRQDVQQYLTKLAADHKKEVDGLREELAQSQARAAELERALTARSHQEQKDDLPLAEAVCRAEWYIQLCREKLQEEQIIQRWQDMKEESR